MGTKERKSTESGKIFDKASTAFFSNKKALARATRIFLDSAEDFCDQMERELKPDENVFEKLWTYVVQTNADMLYGEGDNAGRIVCRTISSINKEGLFSPAVRAAGDDLRVVLDKSYAERVAEPEKFEDEDSLFEEPRGWGVETRTEKEVEVEVEVEIEVDIMEMEIAIEVEVEVDIEMDIDMKMETPRPRSEAPEGVPHGVVRNPVELASEGSRVAFERLSDPGSKLPGSSSGKLAVKPSSSSAPQRLSRKAITSVEG